MIRIFSRKVDTAIAGASLALNVVLAVWIGTRWQDHGPPSIAKIQAQLIDDMPAADRPTLRAVLEAEQANFLPTFHKLQERRAAVDKATRAEPFDAGALQQAMKDWNRQWTIAADLFSEAVVQGLAKVSPEGRRSFAEHLPKEHD
ncbi:hypothetical protein ROTAS13_02255 [Roseomonas sp. TAS13]|uniref:periplasmic heavy metal sensor n=1 Tax=Roseomonas sp. TAS13 TaxID=1926319 RepID=UPI0009693706|nr:periplasmic heavy metal sensor [Roseomonas sp. TAS13]USQ74204.1 periplasmic heavy metal sensor [Roseomonas mucosa]GAV34587.1 hypothetical protein ROTAS13_02255 [Roseomonas sp. TAS13]